MRQLFLTILLLTPIILLASEEFYIVKPGDTLSKLSKKFFGTPVYSEQGSLSKLSQLNPEIRNIDLIYPGQRIIVHHGKTKDVFKEEPLIKISHLDEKKDSLSKRYSKFGIASEFRFIRVDMENDRNQETTVLSHSYLNISPSWEQSWSDAFSTYQKFTLTNVVFEESSNGNKLNKKELSYFELGVGAKFFKNKRNRFSTELSMEQMPYLVSNKDDSADFELATVPSAKLKTEHDLIILNPFTLGVGGYGASYLGSKTESLKTKLAHTLGVQSYIKQDFSQSVLTGVVKYWRTQQDTSISKQSRVDLGFEINYTLSFDGENK